MPNKHVHKSLESINKKAHFLLAFLQSHQLFFIKLISILVRASMYFNYYIYLFYISTRYDSELVKLKHLCVRQASKSTSGTLRRSFEITRWSVNTLTSKKIATLKQ